MFNISKQKSDDKSITENRPVSMDDLESYFSDFEKSFFGSRLPLAFRWPTPARIASALEVRIPNIDVVDHDKEVVVKAELPGIDKNDIDIKLTENTVTIKAEKKREEKEEKDNYFHQEISRASYSRSFTLPTKVDSENAKASFKDGILEIILAKREPASSKKINIA